MMQPLCCVWDTFKIDYNEIGHIGDEIRDTTHLKHTLSFSLPIASLESIFFHFRKKGLIKCNSPREVLFHPWQKESRWGSLSLTENVLQQEMEHNPNRCFQCHLHLQAISSGVKGLSHLRDHAHFSILHKPFQWTDGCYQSMNWLGIFSHRRAQSHKAISTMPK